MRSHAGEKANRYTIRCSEWCQGRPETFSRLTMPRWQIKKEIGGHAGGAGPPVNSVKFNFFLWLSQNYFFTTGPSGQTTRP